MPVRASQLPQLPASVFVLSLAGGCAEPRDVTQIGVQPLGKLALGKVGAGAILPMTPNHFRQRSSEL